MVEPDETEVRFIRDILGENVPHVTIISWNKYNIQRAKQSLLGVGVGVVFVLASLHSLQDLSFLTRDQTQAPCSESVESETLDHQEIPLCFLNWIDFTKNLCLE